MKIVHDEITYEITASAEEDNRYVVGVQHHDGYVVLSTCKTTTWKNGVLDSRRSGVVVRDVGVLDSIIGMLEAARVTIKGEG